MFQFWNQSLLRLKQTVVKDTRFAKQSVYKHNTAKTCNWWNNRW